MSLIDADGSPQVIVAHQGLGNDGQLWATSVNGAKQTGDQQVPNTGMSGSPALLVLGDILYFFHQGFGNDGQLWCNSNDGYHGWTGDQQVPNTGMSESPAAAVYGGGWGAGQLWVCHQGPGNDGQLWLNSYNGSSWTGDRQVPNTGMSGSPALAVYPPPDSGPGDDTGSGGGAVPHDPDPDNDPDGT
jgi:hypothetical protein